MLLVKKICKKDTTVSIWNHSFLLINFYMWSYVLFGYSKGLNDAALTINRYSNLIIKGVILITQFVKKLVNIYIHIKWLDDVIHTYCPLSWRFWNDISL